MSYLEATQKAQKKRMIIIGKFAEYKNNYPQRSKANLALTTVMSEEGWLKYVICNDVSAFKA